LCLLFFFYEEFNKNSKACTQSSRIASVAASKSKVRDLAKREKQRLSISPVRAEGNFRMKNEENKMLADYTNAIVKIISIAKNNFTYLDRDQMKEILT